LGYFKLKGKFSLDDITEDTKIAESDFCTLTPKGNFVQLEYVETEEEITEYEVKPGVWTIQSSQSRGLFLEKTSFVHDKILKEFLSTKNIVDKVDSFFNRLHVYKKHGIEVPTRKGLLYGPPGCHAKGTKILMYDGSLKNVEDITIGEKLMGPDSKPREVLKLAYGKEKMVKIIPTKGESFVVNMNHMLHLTPSGNHNSGFQHSIDIKFSDYIKNSLCFQERLKLTRTGIEFNKKQLSIPPYILGSWLGDGSSSRPEITSMDKEIVNEWKDYSNTIGLNFNKCQQSGKSFTYSITRGNEKGHGKKGKNSFLSELQNLNVINNKHIPKDYLTTIKHDRLELLAGLIDTDGSLSGNGFDYITKSDLLANDILYLVRSLGLAAYKTECKKCDQHGTEGIYQRISISGNTEEIPTKLIRKQASKRKQIKSVLRTGFKYEILPEDEYFGFTLDKDHLYLTSDFTIHHNSGKTVSIAEVTDKYSKDDKTATVLWPTNKYKSYQVKDFIKSFKYNVDRLILIAEDLGGTSYDQGKMESGSDLLSLLDNQEKTFKIPTYILATTNFPETLLSNIGNRYGRFDDKTKVDYPNPSQRELLYNFMNDREIDQKVITTIKSKECDEFTPAHIREVIIRSDLHDKEHSEVIKDILKEIQEYKTEFKNKRNNMSIVPDFDD
jgi:hypothetical protein